MTTEKHSWKQTPLSPNLTNRCCKQGTHQQTTFTDPQTCCYNQVQQQLEPLYSDYNPAISWNSFRRCRTAAYLTGKKSEACVLVDRASSPNLSAYLSITHENSGIVQRTWQHAKRGGEKERETERETGKVGACVKSQQSSEGGPMGATHLYARHPPPLLLGAAAARRLVAPPWFPPPTVSSSFTNPGV